MAITLYTLLLFSTLLHCSGLFVPSIRNRQVILRGTASDYADGNVMTLNSFLVEMTRSNPDHADFESLFGSIQIACKTIATLLSRAGVEDLLGNKNMVKPEIWGTGTGAEGTAVERSPLYDVAEKILKNSLKFTGKLGVLVSEKEDQAIVVDEAWNSKYIAVFDPLDGSSRIDVGGVTGTIFSVYTEEEECLNDYGETVSAASQECLLKALKTSKRLVAAGYCLYSSSTIMMLSIGDGVHGFTLDPYIGEFILTHPNVKIPKRGRVYSINESNQYKWTPGLQEYIDKIKQGKGELGFSYTSRYISSLIGDIHRTLIYGGIFGYPSDSKRPDGKLRLLNEVRPLAFLLEQAGGKASTGREPLLEVELKTLHDHVSAFMGSYDDVTEMEKYY